MFMIYWTSEDLMGNIPMGEFATKAAAEAGMAAATQELLSEALDDCEDHEGVEGLLTKRAVEAGTWSIEEE